VFDFEGGPIPTCRETPLIIMSQGGKDSPGEEQMSVFYITTLIDPLDYKAGFGIIMSI